MAPRRFPVIMNPTAGGGRLLKHRGRLQAAAAQCDATLEWWYTEHPRHGEELARRAAAEGYPVVFAFGGDGSYNEVASGLVGSDCALAVLPGGTASVLVHEFGIPRPPEKALKALLHGSDRRMRVGYSNREELVMLMLSAGPDAVVLERLNPRVKKIGGRAGIALQGLYELLLRTPKTALRVACGGREYEGSWVIAGKCRCYGGGLRMTPAADPFSPEFQVVVLRSTGRFATASFMVSFAFARHLQRNDVEVLFGDHVELESKQPARYQIDGDLGHRLPVVMQLHPEQLRIRLPGGDYEQSRSIKP